MGGTEQGLPWPGLALGDRLGGNPHLLRLEQTPQSRSAVLVLSFAAGVMTRQPRSS